MLAVFTVGPGGEFPTIQAAVDHARNNDEFLLYPGSFFENVDLSRLGIAIGNHSTNVKFHGTDGQSAIVSSEGAAVSNSAPLTANVTFDGITFTSASPTAETTGIRLDEFQGGLSIIDSVFQGFSEAGLVLRNVDLDLLIENNTFGNAGTEAGKLAIDISGFAGQGAISFNNIQHATDTGIVISNTGDELSSLLINENTISGDGSFFATTDVGVAVHLGGASNTDLSLDRNTVQAMGDAGIKLDVADNADVHTRWTHNVVSNVNGQLAIGVTLNDTSDTTFTALQNTIADTRHDGMEILVSHEASLRGILNQNKFETIGDGAGDDGLTVLADATSSGNVHIQLDKNNFTAVMGVGLHLIADGDATWHASVTENLFTGTNTISGEAAFVAEQPATTSAADVNITVAGNNVFDVSAGAYALHQRGTGSFSLEGTAADAMTELETSNSGDPVVVDGSVAIIQPGTISADMPALIGNFVWVDADGDGIQDPSEAGLSRVTFWLYGVENGSHKEVRRRTQSDASGAFYFGVPPGEYVMGIEVPLGYELTLPKRGNDPQLDSDFTPTNFQLIDWLVSVPATDLSLDAGLLSLWQNPMQQYDVSGDGFVVPADVLIIINGINVEGIMSFRPPAFGYDPPSPLYPPPYYDTNGDGLLTSFDALGIINYLNGVVSVEGESAVDIVLWFEGDDGSTTLPNDNAGSSVERAESFVVGESWSNSRPTVSDYVPSSDRQRSAIHTQSGDASLFDLALDELLSGLEHGVV